MVLALSAAGWWLWQTFRPMPVAAMTMEAAPIVPPPAQALPPPVASSSEPSLLEPAAARAPVMVTVRAPSVAARKPRRPVSIKSAPVVQPTADEMPIEKRYALFLQAMKANDLVVAGEQLKALQVKMPAGILSRLRAEAWFALRSGQDATARQAYRDILEQSPGDEEASVNLASIEARADRREVARQVLNDALRRNPDSDVLHHAVGRFKTPTAN